MNRLKTRAIVNRVEFEIKDHHGFVEKTGFYPVGWNQKFKDLHTAKEIRIEQNTTWDIARAIRREIVELYRN
jgi:hypothetical protein